MGGKNKNERVIIWFIVSQNFVILVENIKVPWKTFRLSTIFFCSVFKNNYLGLSL